MIISEFNTVYKEKGGMGKLLEFKALGMSPMFIAQHFGVSKRTVFNWMKEYFGSNYDSRSLQREQLIEAMVDFARMHPQDVFRKAFRGNVDQAVVHEALEECKNQGIYES